jgi:hypothetical protein
VRRLKVLYDSGFFEDASKNPAAGDVLATET